MTTPGDDLGVAIANITAQIREITANPKPDYSIDGQSVSWASYLSMLNSQLIALQQAKQSLEGPFQRVTRVRA
jgi:hypothetical protein